MRILVVTAGSRGDVAPFTGLGLRLQEAGHQVTLAAHDRFAAFVRESGLDHRHLPGDPVALTRARTAAPSPEDARAVFATFLDELGDGIADAVAAGADLVLTAFGPAPVTRLVAAGHGIPSIGVYLAPGVPTHEFPPPGAPSWDVLTRPNPLYADVLRRLGDRFGGEVPADGPVCHGYSPLVVPRPADWPANVHVTGYWWPAGSADWQPPARLADFLAAGPPPVFIGFGSMTPDDERLGDLVVAAVRGAGCRAVVQAGWAGLDLAGADDLLGIGDVPHEWLFPRTAAVVHHAGAGTTAAGLRAGVPTVAVPMVVDQPFWADRLHALGVAPQPVPYADLTADALAGAIRACLDQPSYAERAAALGERIRAEDGAGAVLDLIGPFQA